MGKKGPCFHCGINSTPLWRNGPAEKPVLCNACGSRYRLWRNLENYAPKHSPYLSNLKNMYSKDNILNIQDKVPSHVDVPGPSNKLTSDSSKSAQGKKKVSWWGSSVPSKKRSKVGQKKTNPIQKFHKQLLSWWKHERKTKEYSAPEEVLMDNVNNLVPSNEIGVGGIVLLKPDIFTSAEN